MVNLRLASRSEAVLGPRPPERSAPAAVGKLHESEAATLAPRSRPPPLRSGQRHAISPCARLRFNEAISGQGGITTQVGYRIGSEKVERRMGAVAWPFGNAPFHQPPGRRRRSPAPGFPQNVACGISRTTLFRLVLPIQPVSCCKPVPRPRCAKFPVQIWKPRPIIFAQWRILPS